MTNSTTIKTKSAATMTTLAAVLRFIFLAVPVG